MCGFCGFTGQIASPEEILESMKNKIIHRGPDSDGSHLDDGIAMGFRRLSFVDLEGGSQPIYNETRDMVITFNGEIYNHRELREELEAKGHVMGSRADTEVLIHGYEEWGEELLQKLRGMFAFVIWDKKNKSIFGARDFFGIKPFYYTIANGNLIYASEIKAILAHPDVRKEVNPIALENYLTFQYSVLEETFFKGIFKLMPAHCFTFKDGKMDIKRYWEPVFEADHSKSLEEYVDEIDAAMQDSIKAHKVADVEVGSFLSSGVDSSYVAACFHGDKTFTVGFDYEKYNEIDYAKALSEKIKIDNYSKLISKKEYWDSIPTVQYHMDEPLADASAIALYFVTKTASEQVKTCMSGEGADELFGGYPLYRQAVWAERWQIMPRAVRRALAALLPGCGLLHRGALPRRQRPARADYVFETTQERDKYLKRDYCAPTPAQRCKPYFDAERGLDEPTAVQWVDWQTWLPRDLLRKADRMSMAHSLELRVPFLDRQVLAAAQALPRRYRCTGRRGKIALRAAAARRLPPQLADAPKRGFPVPLADWLRQEKYYALVKAKLTGPVAERFFDTGALCALLDAHRAGKTNAMTKLWAFYCFIEWYEVYFTGKIPPDL